MFFFNFPDPRINQSQHPDSPFIRPIKEEKNTINTMNDRNAVVLRDPDNNKNVRDV